MDDDKKLVWDGENHVPEEGYENNVIDMHQAIKERMENTILSDDKVAHYRLIWHRIEEFKRSA